MSSEADSGKGKLVQAETEKLPEGKEFATQSDNGEKKTDFECPVCLQKASFPVQLPCRHIFCFLCVKGVANHSRRCALCRQDIPEDFFNHPKVLTVLCEEEVKEKSRAIYDEGYQWFYEGRNGWWQYEERASNELEVKYKKGEKTFELMIAGYMYIIDLENMKQIRKNHQSRKRRIRRDLRSIPDIKGIAGLKYQENQSVRPSGDGNEGATADANQISIASRARPSASYHSHLLGMPASDSGPSGLDDASPMPSAPNNTPQTPMTPADSHPGSLSGSQEDLHVNFQNLNINSNNSSRGSPTPYGMDANLHYSHLSHSPSDSYRRPYVSDDDTSLDSVASAHGLPLDEGSSVDLPSLASHDDAAASNALDGSPANTTQPDCDANLGTFV